MHFSPHVSKNQIGGILQPIDKRLVDKTGELVGEGVKTVDEMKRHLRQFIKTELFPGQSPPASTNRRYYPTDVDIRNHMYQASVKKKSFPNLIRKTLKRKLKIGVRRTHKTLSILDPVPYQPHQQLLKA